MSRTSDGSSTSRSPAFPFRSRTAPIPDEPRQRPPKPRKLNSLFRFNKESDYNQSPSTSGTHDNHHSRSIHTYDDDDDDDDDDDYSDNGTVQPGQGQYTLRVINPDPESSDEEEEVPPKQPSATKVETSSVKLEIAQPPPSQNGEHNGKAKSPIPFVTSFLSTAPSPTASSLSLNSSSNNGVSELVRRQSKTLHEQGKVELLPPLDLPPLDWTIPPVETQPKLYARVVLGPAPLLEEKDDHGLLVASPSTITVDDNRNSGTFMQPPPPQPPHTVDMRKVSVSPSIGESGILPSSMYGNRSIASTANESVLTSTMTRAPQSKYSKASYSLTNNRDALKLYREMAEKTNNTEVQLSYANYLLEIARLYGSKPVEKTHHKSSSLSIAMNRRQSRDSSVSIDGRLNDMMKRGRASLNGPMRNFRPMLFLDGDNAMDNSEKKRALEEEGVRWIKRLAKEEVGEAAYLLATWMDEQKYGCRPNPAKSFRLYDIAARKGKAEAMYAVAVYHERHGNDIEAVTSYKAAAEKGLVAAVHRLAQVHLHGELSQRQNMITGLALLSQAAENADDSYLEPLCMFGQVLANIYPRADIPNELVQPYGGVGAARGWFERGAELGHPQCQTQLGSMYEHGLFGAQVDMSKSFRYYEYAAERGDAEAMLGLSRLYNADRHGPDDMEDRTQRDVSHWLEDRGRNEDASFHWCEKAAEQGLDEALFLLGWYYEIGFGTPRDYNRAQSYYRRAAAKGHHGASERLKSGNFTRQQPEPFAHHRAVQESRRDQCHIM